jgi:hypothetical protein
MPVGLQRADVYSGMGTMTLQSFIKHVKFPCFEHHRPTSLYDFLT